MQSKLETRWTDESILTAYNPFREMFRDASAEVVRTVFGQYVNPEDSIIEIGSGLGELVSLVPEFKGQVQQTEQSQNIAEGNKRLVPDSNVKVANVYDLPFQDESFEIAVGYSAFDTLENLEDALIEVNRVLVPNGKFIHFLDIEASANTVFHRYENKEVIPFPFTELDPENSLMYLTGVQLVRKEDLQKLRNFFVSKHEKLGSIFDYYAQNPELMFVTSYEKPEYKSTLMMYSDLVTESGVDTALVRFNDDFKNNMEQSLRNTKFQILDSTNKDEGVIVERDGRYSDKPQLNVFHNSTGQDRSRLDQSIVGELGSDKVKVISTHYVAIAQKV